MNDLVHSLQRQGIIRTQQVANVMSQVDRAHYLCSEYPYLDTPQPIGFNATISAPHMHAFALENLIDFLTPDAKVLDVGSGSGYLVSCIAKLLGPQGKVVGIEHIPELVEQSAKNIERDQPGLISSGKAFLVVGDGRLGYKPEAPYDVIHVGASALTEPEALIDQLKPGGVLLIPLGDFMQEFCALVKQHDGSIKKSPLLSVRYVPLCNKSEQLQ